MAEYVSRKRVGVRKVEVRDLRHIRIHYDENLYLMACNRGGIWNFGDGEIAVAYLAFPMDYQTELPDSWTRHAGYPRTLGGRHEKWGAQSGVMLSRSFDNGETWPESERQWIWNNDRSLDEILDWLRPVNPKEREQIDLGDPDSIIHFCHGEYLKYPFGGDQSSWYDESENFHLGRRPPPSFSLRSRDRGRTWESHATVIEGPNVDGGFRVVNLGHVRFDNGVLGIVGSGRRRDGQDAVCFMVSYDNALTWRFMSEVARVPYAPNPGYHHSYFGIGRVPHTPNPGYRYIYRGPDPRYTPMVGVRYTYLGVHRLPDARLLCCMHRLQENYPCVAFSEDEGMTWSEPRPIVSPGTYCGPVSGPKPERAPRDWSGNLYRCPRALVTRDGRILVLFARRNPARGCRGICGVLSDDLGETWSEEFVIRGDGYTFDLGYEEVTELEDGRFFAAYWFTTKDGDEPVPEPQVVRHVAGSFFRLD